MIKIIIGANYGDEGKGRTVAHFSNENTINILTNGGAQRGHTADKHIFHHFGSGTKRGAISYFFRDFLIDPVIFLKEYKSLCKEGCLLICYRDVDCRWVTPYDVIANQYLERSRNEKHGSCGMGIWQTIERYREFGQFPTIDDFNNMSENEKIYSLKLIREYECEILHENKVEVPHFIFSNYIIKNYINDMIEFAKIVKLRELKSMRNKNWVFENAQGLLLNSDIDNVHTTPSETGCKKVIDYLNEIENKEDVEIIYVTRPYLTRHGAGPFDECSREELGVEQDKTNIYNEFQGNIRYGKLNKEKLIDRINKDFSYAKDCKKSLSITHLDEMNLEINDKSFYKIYKFMNA